MMIACQRRRTTPPLLVGLVIAIASGCAYERKYFTETPHIRAASEAFGDGRSDEPVRLSAINGLGRPVTVLLGRDATAKPLGGTHVVPISDVQASSESFDVVIVPSRSKTGLAYATLVAGLLLIPLGVAAGVLTAQDAQSTEMAATWGTYGATLGITVGLGLALGLSSGIDDDELPR